MVFAASRRPVAALTPGVRVGARRERRTAGQCRRRSADSETRDTRKNMANEPGGAGANRSSPPPGGVFVSVPSVAVISSLKKPVSAEEKSVR